MVDNEFDRLIELNETIVSQNEKLIAQNDRIIRLLSKLTGDDEKVGMPNLDVVVGEDGKVIVGENLTDSAGDTTPSKPKEQIIDEKSDIIEDDEDYLLDFDLDAGEVLFVSNSSDGGIDIYKLSVKASDEFKVVPDEIQSEIESEIGSVNNEIIIENLTGDGTTSQFKVPLLVAFESFNQDIPIDSNRVILDDETFDNLPEILRVAIENGAKKVHLSLKNAMATLGAPPMIVNYLEFYKNREQIFEKLF